MIGVLGSLLGLLVGFVLTYAWCWPSRRSASHSRQRSKIGADQRRQRRPDRDDDHRRLGHDPGTPGREDRADRGAARSRRRARPVLAGRIIASIVLVGGGILGLLFGSAAPVLGVGAFALFIGVIVGGPFIAVGGATLLRR